VSKQLLYYEKVTPITADRHKDLYVKAPDDYGFARHSNSVPLMAVEFGPAAVDFAIVFAGDKSSVMPVAMLGVENDQNLFIDEHGSWEASYIPAFVRRYPFVFSKNEDGDTFFLCIDEDFAGCNDAGRGERLFDADGERTQYLGSVLNFVQEYQAQFVRTQAFCAKLRELDLLEPMQAQFSLPSGKKAALTGFMAVNRAKLKGLDADKLSALAQTDELELIYLHLQSMRNFAAMLKRVGGEDADQSDAAATNVSGAVADGDLTDEATAH
jgi:hypothetical protein